MLLAIFCYCYYSIIEFALIITLSHLYFWFYVVLPFFGYLLKLLIFQCQFKYIRYALFSTSSAITTQPSQCQRKRACDKTHQSTSRPLFLYIAIDFYLQSSNNHQQHSFKDLNNYQINSISLNYIIHLNATIYLIYYFCNLSLSLSFTDNLQLFRYIHTF